MSIFFWTILFEGLVARGADESIYWMELLVDANLIRMNLLANLMQEANEILAMVVASMNTAKRKKRVR